MSPSLTPAEQVAFALLATYLLHSTTLLGGAWLALRLGRVRSDWLIERVWKLAAAAGLLTAPLSVLCGVSQPIYCWTIGETGQGSGTERNEPDRGDGKRSTGTIPSHEVLAAGSPGDSPHEDGTFPVTHHEIAFAGHGLEKADSTPADASPPVVVASVAADDRLRNSFFGSDRAKSGSIVPAAPRREWRRAMIRGVLFTAVFVMAVGALRLVVPSRRLARQLARAQVVSKGQVAAALARVLRRSESRRRVRLLVSEEFVEPAACGVWRPTIVLPRAFERQWSADELEALLAHEAAHLARGDVAWLLLGRLLGACLPFQPLNFVARHAWRQAEEFLCDAWAVRHGARPLRLAQCLTRLAEQRLPATAAVAGLGVGGARPTLSRRIERLVEGNFPPGGRAASRGRRTVLVVAAAMIVGFGVWGPQGHAWIEEGPKPEMAATPPEPASSHSPASRAVSDVSEELNRLDADWRRAEALLERLPHDVETAELIHRLKGRMTDLRQRSERQSLDALP